MKKGMNMLLWSSRVTEEQHAPLFAGIKEAGYEGVEITVAEGTLAEYESLRRRVEDEGLEATALVACAPDTNPISPDPAVRAAALDHLKRAVGRAHALGAKSLGGPFHSAYAEFVGRPPIDDERTWCVEVLRAAAEEAQQAGVRMALEYLNRFECYVCTTAEEAREIVRRVDHPGLCMLYDTHHAHIEEKDVATAITSCAAEIGHVHISESDRGIPGTGQVHWEATFRALRDIEYDGWLMIEAFSRIDADFASAIRVWRDFFPSTDEVVRQGSAFLSRMWPSG